MGYRSLAECVRDLEATRQLVVIDQEVDPYLEIAAVQRRVYQAAGPALLFRRARGTAFPILGNLFGTVDRAKFLFRDALETVRRLVELKVEPGNFAKNPWRYRGVPHALWRLQPRRVRSGPILAHQITVGQLPHVQCWPMDGGPFITLPQVYTEDPDSPGLGKSNLGMYRVQLAGNQYVANREVGLHYQIHRGIGVHHAAAIRRGESLRVNVSVGGPPALTLAAVMPLPEGLPELAFAGALGGRRVSMVAPDGCLPMPAQADFVICGSIDPVNRKPEGPFGDHLGYYSLRHDFPVLRVERVYRRDGAIWPFTSVGRPPQEDTSFGTLIHELTGPVIPTVIPGLHAVHAVDAAGVHPLLLAIASERYVPDAKVRRPQEILTTANALLGQGQLSLAKYLLIVCREDDPALDVHDVSGFLNHLLGRVDWKTDLHFQTQTTIDTLDYSGHGLNQGSKVVIATAGEPRRDLATELPAAMRLPDHFHNPKVVLPGILAVQGRPYRDVPGDAAEFCRFFADDEPVRGFPLIVIVDDSEFTAQSERDFLWVTFTRSDPAADIDGIGAFIDKKHWGCTGSLVIDARMKPHHAPPLIDDPEIERRVDQLAAPGGPFTGSTDIVASQIRERRIDDQAGSQTRIGSLAGHLPSTISPERTCITRPGAVPMDAENRESPGPSPSSTEASREQEPQTEPVAAAGELSLPPDPHVLVQRLVEAGEWPEPELLEQIVSAGDAIVESLIEILQARPRGWPAEASLEHAIGLSRILRPANAIPELIEVVKCYKNDVAHAAVEALVDFDAPGFDALVDLCGDPSLSGYPRAFVVEGAGHAASDDPDRRSRLAGALRPILEELIAKAREELRLNGFLAKDPPEGELDDEHEEFDDLDAWDDGATDEQPIDEEPIDEEDDLDTEPFDEILPSNEDDSELDELDDDEPEPYVAEELGYVVDVLADLADPWALEPIRTAFREGLVDEEIIDQAWVEHCYSETGEPTEPRLKLDWLSLYRERYAEHIEEQNQVLTPPPAYVPRPNDRYQDRYEEPEPPPEVPVTAPIRNNGPKLGRNDPCWCGSGKKYKKCHLGKNAAP